jgi:hypothetical protein
LARPRLLIAKPVVPYPPRAGTHRVTILLIDSLR